MDLIDPSAYKYEWNEREGGWGEVVTFRLLVKTKSYRLSSSGRKQQGVFHVFSKSSGRSWNDSKILVSQILG